MPERVQESLSADSDAEVVRSRGRRGRRRGRVDVLGTLRVSGTTLSFTPFEGGGAGLIVDIAQIKWIRRGSTSFRVSVVDQGSIVFEVPEQYPDRPNRTPVERNLKREAEQQSPMARRVDALVISLVDQGVSYRQSVYGPLSSEPPFRRVDIPAEEVPLTDYRTGSEFAKDAAKGGLYALAGIPLLFAATSIHFILAAPLFAGVALIGNVLGLGSESVPRSWVELLIEVAVIAYGVTYFVFSRRYRPRLRWAQFAMVILPMVGFIAWILWVVV